MSQHEDYSVKFPKKERDVLELLKQDLTAKVIAGAIEISLSTVRERIRQSCIRARVLDESELKLFLLQNPKILLRDAECAPGLHIPIMRDAQDFAFDGKMEPCDCGKPGCLGWVDMLLKKA